MYISTVKRESAILVATLSLTFTLTACTIGDTDHLKTDPTTTTSLQRPPTSENASLKPSTTQQKLGDSGQIDSDELRQIVAKVTKEHSGKAGIEVVNSKAQYSSTTLDIGPAWSTIKVAVALAAENNGSASDSDLTAAITRSDNSSADRLWRGLGSNEEAAAKVSAELSSYGSDAQVPDSKSRPEFSIFGQTQWPIADQANFGFQLNCKNPDSPVLEKMRQIVPGQAFGLGKISNAAFKGGWGPDTNGSYLVRQFGVVRTKTGSAGAALIAQASDGSFETGKAMLDQMAVLLNSSGLLEKYASPCD